MPKHILKFAVDDVDTDKFLYFSENDDGDIKYITNDEETEQAAKVWKMTPQAVRDIKGSLQGIIEDIREKTSEDLADIYRECRRK